MLHFLDKKSAFSSKDRDIIYPIFGNTAEGYEWIMMC